ncbi:hypothetical protein pipiens_004206 [Culex pipiens pipiens]|uniref:Uncharacterized protein n=1 Tax=Culex pipiens pipiens TaxID=38569 RepID=A0ABD1CLP2_CULPP
MDRKLLPAILASLAPGATSIDPLLLDHHNRKLLLHKAVRLRHPKKLAIVQFLIKTNLADSDERDDVGGRTASEVALSELRDRELASAMLAAEMERVTDLRGFFVAVIRRGSVPVCELFLELKRFTEGEIFRHVSSAVIELDAKRVVIAEGLRLFLQYQMVRYAHNHFGGDVGGVVDRNAWWMHFAAIEEHWAVLERSFSDRDCNKFDSEFLYRIRMMHNHLYFVKNVAFLSHLPVMEMAFCLAVFVKILECDPEYELYKFLINKLDVMNPDLPLKSFVNFTDHLGVSVLQQFCDGEGGFDGAKLLIEHGANPLAVNQNKHTPLHQALLTTGSQESLRFLNLYVENDWRSSDGMTRAIEMPNAFGLSPLHAAVTGGHAEVFATPIVEYLIDADLNDQIPPANLEKLKLLLLTREPKFNSIALHAAANCGRIENCRFILDCQNLYNRHSKNKLNLARNQYDIRGLTPWELAIEGKQKSVLDLFREDQ